MDVLLLYKWGFCAMKSDVCFVYCFLKPFVTLLRENTKVIDVVRCHQLNIMLPWNNKKVKKRC